MVQHQRGSDLVEALGAEQRDVAPLLGVELVGDLNVLLEDGGHGVLVLDRIEQSPTGLGRVDDADALLGSHHVRPLGEGRRFGDATLAAEREGEQYDGESGHEQSVSTARAPVTYPLFAMHPSGDVAPRPDGARSTGSARFVRRPQHLCCFEHAETRVAEHCAIHA